MAKDVVFIAEPFVTMYAIHLVLAIRAIALLATFARERARLAPRLFAYLARPHLVGVALAYLAFCHGMGVGIAYKEFGCSLGKCKTTIKKNQPWHESLAL